MRRVSKVSAVAALTFIAVFVLVHALFVGAQQYQRQELEQHRQYLRVLLARNPSVAQVETAIGDEPLRVAMPTDAASISRVWTDPRNDPTEIEAKVRKWPQTRIYRKSPMIYLIYFDSQGVMRDFSCLAS